MARNYEDLTELIAMDAAASKYYASLPDYVQEMISDRGDNVNSYESLRDYAENLLRGDD